MPANRNKHFPRLIPLYNFLDDIGQNEEWFWNAYARGEAPRVVTINGAEFIQSDELLRWDSGLKAAATNRQIFAMAGKGAQ